MLRYLSKRLLPLFILLSLCLTICLANEGTTAISADESPQPSRAAESPAPIPQTPEDPNGQELVHKALFNLRRYERQNPRPSKKSTQNSVKVLRYVLSLMPKLSTQGPEEKQEHTVLPEPIADAVKMLEEAAEVHNSDDAVYLLAQMNFYGNFSYPRNYSEAFIRYSKLAEKGNSSAQHMVGFMYATGIGGAVERDQAKALLYHTFAAEGGNTRSQMTVGFRHHSGIGTHRSCDQAIQYYKDAADRAIEWYRSGPPGGMSWVPDSYRLADDDGGVYGEGASYSSAGNNANKGGPNSDANAALDDVLEYLDLLSRKGDFKATFSLGRIHYEGQKGFARNMKTAKWYFMNVAKMYWQRDGRVIDSEKPELEKIATRAAGYLGRMFLRGEGMEQSYERAQIWFTRGVKSGDAGSQWGMGLMHLDGLGVVKSTTKAQEYFKAAADQDYGPAQVSLGALYLDQGSPADIKVAVRYFEAAGRFGNIEALYYLADLIDQGIGRDRSCGTATAYYKTVAEKAEPLVSSFAEANQAYEEGDYELALIDYMLAAEQGYERGQANVAYLLDREKSKWYVPSWLNFKTPRSSLLENAALALVYWTRSAKQTNIDSMVKMGDYYLNGIGTQADMDKAAACYTAASEYHQSAQALYNLGWMHENGVGLDQDFHLAKRYYDNALETNEEAYLPVTLSLFKLRLRSAWNTLTNGRINSIQDDPVPKKQWSLAEWVNNFLQDDHPYYGAEYDDDYLPEDSPMPGGDADGMYDDVLEDGYLETAVVLMLAGALVALLYYRQQQQLRHNRQNVGGEQQNQPQEAQQPNEGLFPGVGAPEFNDWVAGGVGH